MNRSKDPQILDNHVPPADLARDISIWVIHAGSRDTSEAGAMPVEGTLIASKVANALVTDAEPSTRAVLAAQTFAAFNFRGTMERFRAQQGGLWVGGTVTLTDRALSFSPNALNRAAHTEDTSWRVSLADIEQVSERFGYVTRIIDVHCRNGSVNTFRCFGARAFADRIAAAAEAARLR
jgi:hypothetical protein